MATGTKYPADVGVQVEKNTKDINTLNQKTQRGAYVYSRTKELNAGEDLNNCVDLDTMYYQSVDTSVENAPPLNGFSLFNIRNNWGIMQEAVYYVDAKTYRRMEFNGTWSEWRELSDMSAHFARADSGSNQYFQIRVRKPQHRDTILVFGNANHVPLDPFVITVDTDGEDGIMAVSSKPGTTAEVIDKLTIKVSGDGIVQWGIYTCIASFPIDPINPT